MGWWDGLGVAFSRSGVQEEERDTQAPDVWIKASTGVGLCITMKAGGKPSVAHRRETYCTDPQLRDAGISMSRSNLMDMAMRSLPLQKPKS